MSVTTLDDGDVDRLGLQHMRHCVDVMQQALALHGQAKLDAPARFGADLPSGRLTFTVGGTVEAPKVVGFRVYDLAHVDKSALRGEATLVFSTVDGALRGVVTGRLLGAVRTGAIGGVAIAHLARPDARVLALVGAGYQARTQLAAALAVRSFAQVRVYSRSSERRASFVAAARTQHELHIDEASSVAAAVDGADVIITATQSSIPLLHAAQLAPGVHVNHIGPSLRHAHELSVDVAECASRVVVDSMAQREALADTFMLAGSASDARLEALGHVVCTRGQKPRSAAAVTLFQSLGLAGTEVLLADSLIALRLAESR